MRADSEELLRRRAEVLARPVDDEVAPDTVAVLVMSVAAGRRCGIEMRHVGRIAASPRLSRLPATCGDFLGVTPVGGQVIPTVDLASILGLGSADPTRAFVVAVHSGRDVIGLLVDAVEDVVELPKAALLPLPEADPGVRLAHLMTSDGLVLLDIDSFFSDDRLVVAPGRLQPPSSGSPHSTQE